MKMLLVRGGMFIVAIAALWAVGVSLYIFSSPVSVQGVTDILLQGSSPVVEAFAREESWFSVQGIWGTLWLLLFVGFYLLAVRLAWRGKHVALAVMSVTAVFLSIVTGFSIGGAYLPAAFGLFIATLMFLSSRLVGTPE